MISNGFKPSDRSMSQKQFRQWYLSVNNDATAAATIFRLRDPEERYETVIVACSCSWFIDTCSISEWRDMGQGNGRFCADFQQTNFRRDKPEAFEPKSCGRDSQLSREDF